MKSINLVLSILLSAGLLLAAPDPLTPASSRKLAPDFTLNDAAGKPLTLSAYKGKVVLLDFWATTCGGCKVELPWYREFDAKYHQQGLTVIGVAMDDEGMKAVKPFLAQNAITYPIVVGTDAVANQYQLTAMPMTLLIDRHGRIAVSHTGIVDKSSFQNHIEALLKQ